MPRLRRRLLLVGAIALVVAGASASPATASRTAASCPNGFVAVAFDVGPTPLTPALLDALAGAGVRSTFFNTDYQTELYSDVVDAQRAAGHAVTTLAVHQVEPGGLILMHDGYNETIAAVPHIAQGLATRGLCPGQIAIGATPSVALYDTPLPAKVVSW